MVFRSRLSAPPTLVFFLTICVLLLAMVSTGRSQVRAPVENPQKLAQVPAVSLPELPARPSHSQAEIEAFVQEVSRRDAAIRVILGEGRLITLQEPLLQPDGADPYIAIGDPTVMDFDVVDPRHLRLTGKRIGVTDLSIVTSGREDYTIEVHVVADLNLLKARLMQAFPDASVTLTPMREHLIVSGQARDTEQVARILAAIQAYLDSIQTSRSTQSKDQATPTSDLPEPEYAPEADAEPADLSNSFGETPATPDPRIIGRTGTALKEKVELTPSRIINLLRVPGPQQVMLRVQVAELNRTAFRQLGVSWLLQNGNNAIGGQVGPVLPGGPAGGAGGGGAASGAGTLLGLLNPVTAGAATPLFGIIDSGRANFIIQALRSNSVLKILAEPNLVAMHGERATFLSGGSFPVPVPQPGSGGNAVTIQYHEFGVSVDFVPHILDDEMIRLAVTPEVSSLDFATGVTVAGVSVPGLNTRRTETVVQLREGQTLAISGILQIELSGNTARVPGLGDLPYIGSFFRNTTSRTVEKELVVLVTPFLVQPLDRGVDPPLPGECVVAPDDFELFLLGRIESRQPSGYRETLGWDDPLGLEKGHRRGGVYYEGAAGSPYDPNLIATPPPQWEIENRYIQGEVGYTP